MHKALNLATIFQWHFALARLAREHFTIYAIKLSKSRGLFVAGKTDFCGIKAKKLNCPFQGPRQHGFDGFGQTHQF